MWKALKGVLGTILQPPDSAPEPQAYRFEDFGGILALSEPPILAYVDQDYMKALGLGPSEKWTAPRKGHLSAPVEAHFALTNRCQAGCPHCYMDSSTAPAGELSRDELKRALSLLARMKVFHVALGGGETFLHPDLFELADFIRELGMVPNVTTSGALMTPGLARRCRVFGQVNVSIDGVGARYHVLRKRPGFPAADRAARMLRDAGVRTGLNCVVCRQNFEHLEELVLYAARARLEEVELLRFKPSGRARQHYQTFRTTDTQNRRFFPLLKNLMKRHRMALKIDCSFVPMLCAHNPPRETLERFAVHGCVGGDVLLGIRPDGTMGGCSFFPAEKLSVLDMEKAWDTAETFRRFRQWPSRAPEPCRACDYLSSCRGGCHAVAAQVENGNFFAPDPECPRVVALQTKSAIRSNSA